LAPGLEQVTRKLSHEQLALIVLRAPWRSRMATIDFEHELLKTIQNNGIAARAGR
jgi:hypothetical protein